MKKEREGGGVELSQTWVNSPPPKKRKNRRKLKKKKLSQRFSKKNYGSDLKKYIYIFWFYKKEWKERKGKEGKGKIVSKIFGSSFINKEFFSKKKEEKNEKKNYSNFQKRKKKERERFYLFIYLLI